jgi:hypothetical protein
MKIEKKRQGLE